MKNEPLYIPEYSSVNKLATLKPLSEKEIRKIIATMKPTTCYMDPIPTKYIKASIATVWPVILKLVNQSLGKGEYSSEWKTSVVIPLLKKNNLTREVKN